MLIPGLVNHYGLEMKIKSSSVIQLSATPQHSEAQYYSSLKLIVLAWIWDNPDYKTEKPFAYLLMDYKYWKNQGQKYCSQQVV